MSRLEHTRKSTLPGSSVADTLALPMQPAVTPSSKSTEGVPLSCPRKLLVCRLAGHQDRSNPLLALMQFADAQNTDMALVR